MKRVHIVGGVPQQVNGKWSLDWYDVLFALPNAGLTLNPIVGDTLDISDKGFFPLTTAAQPVFNSATQRCVDAAPVLLNGAWTQQWSVTAITATEIAAALKTAAANSLAASDVTMIRCVESGVAVPAAWNTYRKALRAIANGTDTTSTALPVIPAYPAGT